MNDPFGSMQGFVGQFQNFMNNPGQMMQQKLNLTQDALSDPNKAIQQLMDSGRMSQAQYNCLSQMANRIQNNPAFRNLMNMK